MKVLLVHLPTEYELTQEFTGDSLGLGYIAAVLRRDGHEVEVFDAVTRNLKPCDVTREIVSREFDCLGISSNHYHQKVLISTVREVRRYRKETPIVVGGYLPTLSTSDLFAACPEIDIMVLGEGETTMSDLMGRLSRIEDWRSTPGIAYMKDGTLVRNPCPPQIKDLDTLPFPVRDGILQAPKDRPLKRIRILGSRGCYYACSFCCIHSFYSISGIPAPRLRSVGSIVDEIEATIASTGIREFRFSDDDFIGPTHKTQEHAMLLAQELRSRRLPITFDIECRADVVSEDILRNLKEAGLTRVFLGIESGSQSQLDRYNKRITVEQNRRGIEMIRSLGLEVSSGFIAFDPYVTIAELAEDIRFLNETGIAEEYGRSSPGMSLHKALTKLAIYPGVPLIKRLQDDGLLRRSDLTVDYKFKTHGSACWTGYSASSRSPAHL